MAKDIDRKIEERIEAFAEELNQLVREAALEAVRDALGTASPSKGGRPARAGTAAGARKRASGGGRGRRSSRQLAGTVNAVHEFIASNPGARMEHMTAALGQPAARLRGPVNKLLEQGKIRKTGEKRATQYYPKGRGGGAKKASRKRSTTKRKKKTGRKTSRRKKR